MAFKYLVTALLVVLSGCSLLSPAGPSSYNPPERKIANPLAKRIPVTVSRAELAERLSVPETVRFIEVYYRNQEMMANNPQYRLFDIRPKGPLEYLGLENADVIVGAHGLVVPSAEAFQQYVEVLHLEKVSSIELVRGGKPILLELKLTD